MAQRIVQRHQHAEMVAKYRAGSTLAQVGAEFGISRERVRQIIAANGVGRIDGGMAVRSLQAIPDKVAKKQLKKARQEAYWRATWGMSLDDYKAVVAEHGSSSHPSSPLRKYIEHRNNAKKRRIAWNFTFVDWWRIWQESGKWEQRGRGPGYHGYVMARYGDADTPYSPDTVYICTQSQNSKDSYLVVPGAVRAEKAKRTIAARK